MSEEPTDNGSHQSVDPDDAGAAIKVDTPEFYIERVIVKNFRGLSDVTLDLERDLTILLGANNVGKSRLLRAVCVAVGGAQVESDDFTNGSKEVPTIDVVVAPMAVDDDGSEEFSTRIHQVFDPQVVSEEPLRTRLAWRLAVSRSAEGHGARSAFHKLLFDAGTGEWYIPNQPSIVPRSVLRLFHGVLIQPGRDLARELKQRGSAVDRVLNDLEIPTASKHGIETRLTAVGATIAGASKTLGAVKAGLDVAVSHMDGMGRPAVTALPVNIEELPSFVSLDFDTGGGALPMRFHGSGPRSVASLMLQAVFYERRMGRDGPDVLPLPITLVEEPEAHLHPQMQFELPSLIGHVPGQKIVSTHSSHMATEAESSSIRLLRRSAAGCHVVDFKPRASAGSASHRARRPDLHLTEMQKLKRLVERPFGELLFASAIVLVDGATERAFLPPLFRVALGSKGSGVTVVDTGSLNGELATAVVKFAKLVDVPWYVYADGDEDCRSAVASLVSSSNAKDQHGSDRVVYIHASGATEAMIQGFDPTVGRAVISKLQPSADPAGDVIRQLKSLKGSSGSYLAREVINLYQQKDWPSSVKEIVNAVRLAMEHP